VIINGSLYGRRIQALLVSSSQQQRQLQLQQHMVVGQQVLPGPLSLLQQQPMVIGFVWLYKDCGRNEALQYEIRMPFQTLEILFYERNNDGVVDNSGFAASTLS